MAGILASVLKHQFFDNNGNPLAGGLLYSYQAGTSTPQSTYTDSGLGAPNANPVVLDSAGRCDLWANPSLSYKYVMKDSSGNTLWTVDNQVGILTADAVNTASLQDRSVTTIKMALLSVDSTILKSSASVDGDRAVTTDHMRDGSATGPKIGAAAISLIKLAAGVLGINSSGLVSKTASFTASMSDDGYNISTALGAVTVSPAASPTAGKIQLFRKSTSDANAATLNFPIDGVTGVKLAAQYDWLLLLCLDGTNWSKLGGRTTSRVYVTGGNGHGSTGTKIRRFVTTVENVGSAITYADSATNGGSFTVNEDGVYAITARDYRAAAQSAWAISLNSAQLTTNWNTITNSTRLAATYGQAAAIGTCSRTVALKAGDVLRLHSDGGNDGAGDDVVGFSVDKVW